MRFICLGHLNVERFSQLTEQEQQDAMERCFAYDDILRRNGHFAGGLALKCPENAVTLHMKGGKVAAKDGPFVETKEYLGGILILEARDMDHAVELMSKHPGVGFGAFEIRPADETINELIAARSNRPMGVSPMD